MVDRIRNAADLFSIVPQPQLDDIFSEWLEIEDIGRLDSAACNGAFRSSLLDFLLDDSYVFRGEIGDHLSYASFFAWSVRRRIKVTQFTLNDAMSTNHGLRHQYLAITGRTLKSIHFCNAGSAEEDMESGDDENAHTFVVAEARQVMFDVAKFCPNLTRLEMPETVLDATLCLLLSKCPHVQYLDISRCPGVSSSILRSICDLPELTELDMSGCRFLPGAVDYHRTPCLSLRTLRAAKCKMSRVFMGAFVCLFPNLTDLTLTETDSYQLRLISDACPLMKFADISVITPLSDAIAQGIANTWCHIIDLSITNAYADDSTVVMSQAAILSVIRQCKTLVRFVLRNNLLQNSINHDKAPTLSVEPGKSELRILLCDNITGPTLSAIVSMCPKLWMFGIMQPPLAPGAAAPVIAYPLDLLRGTAVMSLTLDNCVFTPTCLDSVYDLGEIVLDRCSGLTDASLATLAQHCPKLDRITIINCAGLTVTALIKIVTYCPELRSINFLTRGSGVQERTPQNVLIDALLEKWCPHLITVSII